MQQQINEINSSCTMYCKIKLIHKIIKKLIKVFYKNVKCESCVSSQNLSKADIYILNFVKQTSTF